MTHLSFVVRIVIVVLNFACGCYLFHKDYNYIFRK